MNKFKRVGKSVAVITTGILASAGNAMSAVDLTGVTCDTTTVETLATTVLIGLGVMWGIRKVIKLINRS